MPTADINSLPEELLALVIQSLPWRDRLRAERINSHWRHTALTSGWAHVTHFDNADYALNEGREPVDCRQLSHLLGRCSAFVVSIQLRDQLNRLDAIELLEQCPRVERVVLRLVRIEASLVDYLRERCGRRDRAALRLEPPAIHMS